MNAKERRIDDWALAAYNALNQNWERCDQETNRECRGARCAIGAHRAMIYIHRILEEVSQ